MYHGRIATALLCSFWLPKPLWALASLRPERPKTSPCPKERAPSSLDTSMPGPERASTHPDARLRSDAASMQRPNLSLKRTNKPGLWTRDLVTENERQQPQSQATSQTWAFKARPPCRPRQYFRWLFRPSQGICQTNRAFANSQQASESEAYGSSSGAPLPAAELSGLGHI